MAVVGLEQTFFSVSEGVGVVELCAIVYEPNIICPIEFPFNVRLQTRDGTAGNIPHRPLISTMAFYNNIQLHLMTMEQRM